MDAKGKERQKAEEDRDRLTAKHAEDAKKRRG